MTHVNRFEEMRAKRFELQAYRTALSQRLQELNSDINIRKQEGLKTK